MDALVIGETAPSFSCSFFGCPCQSINSRLHCWKPDEWGEAFIVCPSLPTSHWKCQAMLLQMARLQNAKHKDFPSSLSLIQFVFLGFSGQFPILSIWWGYKASHMKLLLLFLTRFFSSFLLFDLSPHNHWLEAYFNFQYLGLEILRIEIESLAVRVRLNILSRFPSSPGWDLHPDSSESISWLKM